MQNKLQTTPSQTNQIEELRSAIFNYKSTLQKIENSKLKNFNKPYQEIMRKNVHSREDIRLHNSQNLIPQSLSTLILPDFYNFILKISKVHQVTLNVIPSLFLPKPATFLYTNPKGLIEFCDKPQVYDKFFKLMENKRRDTSTPLLIFKRPNRKPKLFTDASQCRIYLKHHKHDTGVLQEFILPPSDRTSICKVLMKDKKFRYLLIINKRAYKEIPRFQQRSASCFEKMKHLKSDESIFFDDIVKKKKETLAQEKDREKLINSPGILNRIQANAIHPWKHKRIIGFCMEDQDSEKFLVNGVNLDDCLVNDLNTNFPEIEKMMLQMVVLIQTLLLNDKIEIQEIVCEFLKDSKKNWKIMSVPLIKVKQTSWTELFHMDSLHFLNIKPETESEPLDDTSMIIDDKSDLNSKKIQFSQSENLSSQHSFKTENNTFQDRFKKTINKIDRIRKREKINANVGLKYEMIQNYKSTLHIDRNGSIDRKLLIGSSESSADVLPSSNSHNQEDFKTRLHSCSKHYDRYNAMKMVADYTKKTVESYENIIKDVRKSKYPTRKLDEKLGGKKFILNFMDSILSKVSILPLARHIKQFESGEQIFCPGLYVVFDCKVNLSLAKLLYDKHSPLNICREEYEQFNEVFLSSLKEFDITQSDFDYLSNLIQKLSRDIYLIRAKSAA